MVRRLPDEGQRGEEGQETSVEDGHDHPPAAARNQQRRRDPRNGRIRFARFWVTDIKSSVATLSPAATGAYLKIVIEYLNRQAPLPDDQQLLCRITGVKRRDWVDIRDELLDVFDLVDGMLVCEIAEKVITEFRAASAKGRANVSKRFEVVNGSLQDGDE